MLFPMKDRMIMNTMNFMSSRFITVSQGGKTYSAIKIMGKQSPGCWVCPPPHSCGTLSTPVCVDSNPRVLVCAISVTAVLPVTQEKTR